MTRKALASKVSADRLETLLVELANVRGADDSIRRFLSKYGEMLSDFPSADKLLSPHVGTSRDQLEKLRIQSLSSHLQYLWRQKTVEAKQFRVATLIGLAQQTGTPGFLVATQVVQPGTFGQALLHLLRSADRLRVCGNPMCRTPYFFRKRRKQTYCSDGCAEFGQKKAKQKWWSDKGDEWRRTRNMRNQPKRGGKRGTSQTR